jgi:hypothetical protein
MGSTTTSSDGFGFDVAIAGGLFAVGAPFDETITTDSGAAFVFDVATGNQVDRLSPTDLISGFTDHFGTSLTMLGSRVAVGAPRYDFLAPTLSGQIFVFNEPGAVLVGALAPVAAPGPDTVGHSLGDSVDGSSTLLVSGSRGDSAFAPGGGSVHVFDAATLQFLRKLYPLDPGFADNFGDQVAVSGRTVAVAAPFDDDQGNDAGSVYVFDGLTGLQRGKFIPPGIGPADFFGSSLAIDGDTVVAGTPFSDMPGVGSFTGSAFVFDAQTSTLLGELAAPNPSSGGQFGDGVAIEGAYILVGESRAANANGVRSGVVHVYDRGSLARVAVLEASDGLLDDALGQSLDIAGNRVVVGARGVDLLGNNSGSAYVFTLP